MLKAITFKLDESKIEVLKAVCDEAGIKQADFINMAIDDLIEKIAREESGGMTLEIPTPYIYQALDDKARFDILELLNETTYRFSKIAGGRLDLGLNKIKQFAEYRLNKDNEARQKEEYLNVFYKFLDIKKIFEKGGNDND